MSVAGPSPETLSVKLSVRGHMRRTTDACQFPPIRVEFAQKPAPTSLFAGQKKLKLVTHCQAALGFQQYLLLEYSAYRLYNVLTPISFRARLAAVDYVDENGRPLISRLGFFLEDAKDVARRNGLREAETGDRVPVAQLSPGDGAREAVFEYMIGNPDWSMSAGPPGAGCCHNTKLLGGKDAMAPLIPVPYDFDSTGLVDPPYAAPPAGVPIEDVVERRYRGYCRHNAEAQAFAAELRAQRPALLAVFDDIPQLDPRSRRKAEAYLGGFFDQIATEQGVTARLLRTCLP